MKTPSLRTLATLTAVLIGAGFALVFFYAPNEADQGFIQKIFYLHVPLAIVALAGFVIGGIHAIRHLRSGDPSADPDPGRPGRRASHRLSRLDRMTPRAARKVNSLPAVWPSPAAMPSATGSAPVVVTTPTR